MKLALSSQSNIVAKRISIKLGSNFLGFLLLTVIFTLLLCSCSNDPTSSGTSSTTSNNTLNIVTTTGMIADLATNIGGSRVKAVALMGSGVDPHLYKATQGDLSRLTQANIVFYNGLHLEGKMTEILSRLSRIKKCIAISQDIPASALRTPIEFEGQPDPHIWFDVQLWMIAAKTILQTLIEVDPSHQAEYQENHRRYVQVLEQLDSWARQQIHTIPKEQRLLITAHDAFGYFGRAYEIDVMGLQGISTATEYGLFDLKRVIDTVITRKVAAIFVESSVPKKFVAAIQEGVSSRGYNIEIGGELFSDAMGPSGSPEGTYEGMIRHNVSTITLALSK